MLSIARVKAETRDRYVLVRVSLENQGATVVGPGTMLGRQTSTGGSVRVVEFRNSTNIPPGGTAKVSQLLSAMTQLEFTGYRQSDGVIIPFSGGMVKRLSFLRSVAAATARWWNEVLVPRSASIVARFRVPQGNAWSFAEVHKRVKDQAQVAGNALGSLDAAIVRWFGGSLVPRSRSIAARFRDQRVRHWQEVGARAWRSTNAELVRWRNEVLLPRTRSIAARFEALHANGWIRREDAKQRSQHRAQMERQAWESADTQIMRWWNEVLQPRTRSIAARFEALRENRWLHLADAKQRIEHRAQVERQAWESADTQIMRWWNEVLLPRTRSIAARFEALRENRWLHLADAKQRIEHRAQAERQAWESADAQIMRWWDEVRRVATEIQRRVGSYRTR